MKICGLAKMDCAHSADISFLRRDERDDCNCLPACTTISYTAYQTIADYDLVSAYSKSIFHKDFNLEKYIRTLVSFQTTINQMEFGLFSAQLSAV